MKFSLIISAVVLIIAAESKATSLHWMFKRHSDDPKSPSVSDSQNGYGKTGHKKIILRYNDDDTKCAQNCANTLKKAYSSKRPTMFGTCINVITGVDCMIACPVSEAKAFYLDQAVVKYSVCRASDQEKNRTEECIIGGDRQKFIKIGESCASQCRTGQYSTLTPQIFPFDGVTVKLEKDSEIVKRDLPKWCKQANCVQNCLKDQNLAEVCGSTTVEYLKDLALVAKHAGKMYAKSGVISASPVECESIDS